MDAPEIEEEARVALKKAAKGLTARQLQAECESSGDVNEMVKVIHRMKAAGSIKADGIRDSQVIYKLADKAPTAAVVAPERKPAAPPALPPATPQRMQRSVAGLREGLFAMLDKIAAGTVENGTAKTYAHTAMTIVKSLEVQLEFERMRLAKEIPTTLDEVALAPALESE